jgi:hypothetical protein
VTYFTIWQGGDAKSAYSEFGYSALPPCGNAQFHFSGRAVRWSRPLSPLFGFDATMEQRTRHLSGGLLQDAGFDIAT